MRATDSAVLEQSSSIAECLDRLRQQHRSSRPLSTYRLQFHREFRFEDARRLVPYLQALGVSHCYSSPILMARAGSMHGYDIVEHNRINPELGTEQEFRSFIGELHRAGMGLVLDIVPNHMGVGHGTNPWWQDVMENGRAAEHASFFDIEWRPLKSELRDKVLLPVLGDQYGVELEEGRIVLDWEDGRMIVRYYDKKWRVDPQTIPMIFEAVFGDANERRARLISEDDSDLKELESILGSLEAVPRHDAVEFEKVQQRRRDLPPLRERLTDLALRSPRVDDLIRRAVRNCNGEPGNSRSFDTLHRLLEAQAYRLAHWRVSAEQINYRRFFDINDLVGLRMENPEVFAATHRLIRRLLADGSVNGLRVDHPDGLFNPRQYFTRVQMLYAASQCAGALPEPPLADNGLEMEVVQNAPRLLEEGRPPLCVLAEKILEPQEELPTEWPVDGTVGYEFANLLNGLFIEHRNRRAFNNIYQRISGASSDVDTLVYESKKLIMETALSSEVNVLSRMLEEISSTDRKARDFTRKTLSDAITETIACFPVYRTYIDERGQVTERDRGYIAQAIARAKRRNENTPANVFDYLRDILLLKAEGDTATERYRDKLYFTLKFQQLTGPVMAKGLEDTACYVYNRFISVNEVGGSPANFGLSLDEFHAGNRKRAELWPGSMLSTSTHDTKRSEDVRARINVISEMPRRWSSEVARWRRWNRTKKKALADGRTVPDGNEEYLLYQTLIGSWPWHVRNQRERGEYVARVQQYMTKAVHEAKVNLSWINPNPEYVQALSDFIARVLDPGAADRPNRFFDDIDELARLTGYFGAINSVAQALLKLTAPGIPDVYQGNELLDFSLVDPDNRRPVNFELRRRLLNHLGERGRQGDLTQLCAEMLRDYDDGRMKMWVTLRALMLRRQRPALFRAGAYIALHCAGEREQNLVAFARANAADFVLVAVPRLSYSMARGEMRPPLGEVWGEAEIGLPPEAPGTMVNLLTGEELTVSSARSLLCREVFAHFPAALLANR